MPTPAPSAPRIFQSNLKRLGIDVDIRFFLVEAFSRRSAREASRIDVALNSWDHRLHGPARVFHRLNSRDIVSKGIPNVAKLRQTALRPHVRAHRSPDEEARRRASTALDVNLMQDNPPWAPFVNVAKRDFISKSFGYYFFTPSTGSTSRRLQEVSVAEFRETGSQCPAITRCRCTRGARAPARTFPHGR